jgi:hypothetical protein
MVTEMGGGVDKFIYSVGRRLRVPVDGKRAWVMDGMATAQWRDEPTTHGLDDAKGAAGPFLYLGEGGLGGAWVTPYTHTRTSIVEFFLGVLWPSSHISRGVVLFFFVLFLLFLLQAPRSRA